MLRNIKNTLRDPLTRLLSLWVKPAVLPENPLHLINPSVPILYVLEVGGTVDTTALKIVCERYGLPDPSANLQFGAANESSSVDALGRRQGILFKKHRKGVSDRLARLVEAGVAINTVEPERSDSGANVKVSSDMNAGPDITELQIVPVALYWGRAPDKESSLWRLWLSENWNFAGRTRKFLGSMFHGRDTLVRFSEPLSFKTLRSSGQPSDILQRKLFRILRVHFRQRRKATLGPDQSHRRMLIGLVLADSSVRKAISESTDGETKALKQAQEYAYEIAADVSYTTVRILHRLLTRLWNELYEGVETSGIDRLNAVADGNELVYVPCHRSHIDYLLLSYILYVKGLSLPHIAAGINLNLPVVGGLLRRGGAFFLRRSFSGKPLYTAVFNAYIKEILQRGHALEYFVEGGRSRTGRLLPPKGGMLAMTIHAFLRKPKTPVIFIPVYFGYERLLEGRAFTSELAGGKKQKETIFGLIKSLRTLRENYGQVYVNFGEPIPLNNLLDKHRENWREQPIPETRPDWIKPIVEDLGIDIMRKINEAASVTPVSLLATTMLATPNGAISLDELTQQIDMYQNLLEAAYADTLVVVPEINAAELIQHGMRLGFIESNEDAIGSVVSIKPGQAAPLTYFRNNILHLLTLPALAAATFINARKRSADKIRHLINLTFQFLQGELFLTTEIKDTSFNQALHALERAGLIHRQGHQWHRAPTGSIQAVSLMRLAQVVAPGLERCYLSASLLARAPDGVISSEELGRRAQMSAERLARTYGSDPGEMHDKYLHRSFVAKLIEQGYVTSENDMLTAQPSLLNVEAEAKTLLSEQARHAIINAALAASLGTISQ